MCLPAVKSSACKLYEKSYANKLDALLGLNESFLLARKIQKALKEKGCLTYLYKNERRAHIHFPFVSNKSFAKSISLTDPKLELLLSLAISQSKSYAQEISAQDRDLKKAETAVHQENKFKFEIEAGKGIRKEATFIVFSPRKDYPDAPSSYELEISSQLQEAIEKMQKKILSRYDKGRKKVLERLLKDPGLVAQMVVKAQGFEPLLGNEFVKLEWNSKFAQWMTDQEENFKPLQKHFEPLQRQVASFLQTGPLQALYNTAKQTNQSEQRSPEEEEWVVVTDKDLPPPTFVYTGNKVTKLRHQLETIHYIEGKIKGAELNAFLAQILRLLSKPDHDCDESWLVAAQSLINEYSASSPLPFIPNGNKIAILRFHLEYILARNNDIKLKITDKEALLNKAKELLSVWDCDCKEEWETSALDCIKVFNRSAVEGKDLKDYKSTLARLQKIYLTIAQPLQKEAPNLRGPAKYLADLIFIRPSAKELRNWFLQAKKVETALKDELIPYYKKKAHSLQLSSAKKNEIDQLFMKNPNLLELHELVSKIEKEVGTKHGTEGSSGSKTSAVILFGS